MNGFIPYLTVLGPLALALIGLSTVFRSRERSGDAVGRAASAAALVNLVAAGVAAFVVIVDGPASIELVTVGGFGITFRLDVLSAIMFGLVAFVGFIVVGFSRNYLAGDSQHERFMALLSLTIASVVLLVLSGNLVQLILGWTSTSYTLHHLLGFYSERSAATLAARKKFYVARIGDLLLIAAAALLVASFGVADIEQIAQAVRADSGRGVVPLVPIAAVLMALAAVLKSAQFPTHGWLLDVMETPTPVSALLHAGIVNAGGFLVIRFADVMLASPSAMLLLAVIGGATALLASVVTLTQTSIKVSLAWSTIAQMGFMVFQCGIGAFSAAVLHIVAHSLYKAHAFLTAGSAAESSESSERGLGQRMTEARQLTITAGLSIMVAMTGAVIGMLVLKKPIDSVLGLILLLGLAQLSVLVSFQRGRVGRALLIALALFGAYTAQHMLISTVLSPVLPPTPEPGFGIILIVTFACIAFPAFFFFQYFALRRADDPWWQTAYVHAKNGFYANAAYNRVLDSLRLSGPLNQKEIL